MKPGDGIGHGLTTELRLTVEAEPEESLNHGACVLAIAAQKLGWSYDEAVQHLKGFWDYEVSLKDRTHGNQES